MNFEYTFDNAVALFAWLVFGTFILGWLCGCLLALADFYTELRQTLQQDSAINRSNLSSSADKTLWGNRYD